MKIITLTILLWTIGCNEYKTEYVVKCGTTKVSYKWSHEYCKVCNKYGCDWKLNSVIKRNKRWH